MKTKKSVIAALVVLAVLLSSCSGQVKARFGGVADLGALPPGVCVPVGRVVSVATQSRGDVDLTVGMKAADGTAVLVTQKYGQTGVRTGSLQWHGSACP